MALWSGLFYRLVSGYILLNLYSAGLYSAIVESRILYMSIRSRMFIVILKIPYHQFLCLIYKLRRELYLSVRKISDCISTQFLYIEAMLVIEHIEACYIFLMNWTFYVYVMIFFTY